MNLPFSRRLCFGEGHCSKSKQDTPRNSMTSGAGSFVNGLQAFSTEKAVQEGTKVTVWFSGGVAESYPVQGGASAVQILGP